MSDKTGTSIAEVTHYPYIDALRGLAFLGVLLVHVRPKWPNIPSPLQEVMVQGARGVQLFFVASALTLVLSMRSRQNREKNPTTNFFIRRFFRIAPLFYCGIVYYLWQNGFGPSDFAPNGIHPWQIIANALFIHGWFPEAISSIQPGFWSIGVEMTFYLLLPFLVARISTLRRAIWVTFFAILGDLVLTAITRKVLLASCPANAQDITGNFFFWWFPTQLPVFLTGFILYFIIARERATASPPSEKYSTSLLLLCISVFLFINCSHKGYSLLKFQVVYGFIFMLLTWSLSLYPHRLFVNPVMRYLGKISYSCYVCHFGVVQLVAPRFPDIASGIRGIGGFSVYLGACLVVTVAVSHITYRLIEVPGIAIGRRLIRRLEARTSGMNAAKTMTLDNAHSGSDITVLL